MAELIWDQTINAGTLIHLGGVVVMVGALYWRTDKRVSMMERAVMEMQRDMHELKGDLKSVSNGVQDLRISHAKIQAKMNGTDRHG